MDLLQEVTTSNFDVKGQTVKHSLQITISRIVMSITCCLSGTEPRQRGVV